LRITVLFLFKYVSSNGKDVMDKSMEAIKVVLTEEKGCFFAVERVSEREPLGRFMAHTFNIY
jgi:hypothetical protein